VAAHPDQRFSAIDHVFVTAGNAVSVTFRADQPSFLAGYTAAAASETGKVATYGGLPIPPVTDFMNGYALGVEYFNTRHGADVEVLGWDLDTQSGLFSFTFTDPAVGFALTQDLFDQGADTVFPVAGATSLGSYDAAVERKTAGSDVRIVYPDFDPFDQFDRDRARVLLTSAIKGFDVATYHQIEALVDGSWASGLVVEDLASGGVDLAPFHRTNNQVPGLVRPALRDIREGIIDGSIPTLP
jgi:basic membrane protein A